MIGRLSGTLIEKKPPTLLIDVGGVGYECLASMQTFYSLPSLGSSLVIHTHVLIREDAHTLIAFLDLKERALFCELLKVNGVGAKLALSILSTLTVEEFAMAVQSQWSEALVKIPGVGKKTADRLCIEMRDRLDFLSNFISSSYESQPLHNKNSPEKEEALNALVALGYKPMLAKKMIDKLASFDNRSVEDIIRSALKSVATV